KAGLGAETKQAHGPAARAWDGFPQAAQRLASRAPDRALLLRDDAREGAGPGLWPPPGTSKRHHPAMAETAVWSVPRGPRSLPGMLGRRADAGLGDRR